jgi:hypothetical protein
MAITILAAHNAAAITRHRRAHIGTHSLAKSALKRLARRNRTPVAV